MGKDYLNQTLLPKHFEVNYNVSNLAFNDSVPIVHAKKTEPESERKKSNTNLCLVRSNLGYVLTHGLAAEECDMRLIKH